MSNRDLASTSGLPLSMVMGLTTWIRARVSDLLQIPEVHNK